MCDFEYDLEIGRLKLIVKMAHLRKLVNMYFLCKCLGIMLIRFEFYFPLFKSMAMYVNDFETKENKI